MRPAMASMRIRDLNLLMRARYGETLPNDAAGRVHLNITAHHLAALPGDHRKRIEGWVGMYAPWCTVGDVAAILTEIATKPKRWRADKLAWALKLIEEDRKALKITTIGAIDVSKAERDKARRQREIDRKAEKRRAQGVKPRAQYLEEQRAKPKPWLALGMSRRTWYRKGKPSCE